MRTTLVIGVAGALGDQGTRRGRGFAFARYKNQKTWCAVAVELSVDDATAARIDAAVTAYIESLTLALVTLLAGCASQLPYTPNDGALEGITRGALLQLADSALPSLFEACHEEPYAAGGRGFGRRRYAANDAAKAAGDERSPRHRQRAVDHEVRQGQGLHRRVQGRPPQADDRLSLPFRGLQSRGGPARQRDPVRPGLDGVRRQARPRTGRSAGLRVAPGRAAARGSATRATRRERRS